MRRGAAVLTLALALAGGGHAVLAAPALEVEQTEFVLRLDDGRVLRSAALAGAVLDVADAGGAPLRLRIDAVFPHPDTPSVTLHEFRIEAAPGDWRPYCTPDAKGIAAGFPVAGGWTAGGDFIADRSRTFVTCRSGAQAKCILMGYDPWGRAAGGTPLLPLYLACQHMVRAAYCGGQGYTRDGTRIDVFDDAGLQQAATGDDPDFACEAGWTEAGAVCLHHPRRPELHGMEEIRAACPRLAAVAECTETVARGLGARLFNRSRLHPP